MSPKSDSTIVFPAQSADHDTPPLPSGESRPPSGRSGKTPSSGRKGAMRPRRRALDLNRLWMALALGLVTWFVIDFKRMEENTVPVVLSVRTPKDIQIAQLPDRTIEVTLRGSRNAMQAVPRLLRLEAMVDPERIEGNQARVELNESGLQGLPEKVAVLRIEPKEVAVALARRESARLDVEVQVTGEPEKGYNVVNVTAYPTQLAVNGPEVLRLALMRTKLQTEVIDLTGLRRTESRKVNLKPILSEIGVPLEIEQSSVFVTIELEEAHVQEKIPNVPIRLLVSAVDAFRGVDRNTMMNHAWLTPATATVTIEGPRMAVQTFVQRPDLLAVYVPTANFEPDPEAAETAGGGNGAGTFVASVQHAKPEGVRIVQIEPERVKWTIPPEVKP